jgi:DHA2 family multidrug resistance protein
MASQAADQNYVAIPRRALASAIIVVANLMVILDLTVANVSVPHIAGSLGVSNDQGTWIITSYSVSEAISVPLTGWLAARFGPAKLFLAVMAGFATFSLFCGLSVTLEMIVLSRIGQGLCGGLLMPLAQTLLLRIYPPEQHNKAMLLFTTTILLGPALGPNVGGFISDNFSWHWIFLINIPIAIACVTLGYVLLRPAEMKPRKAPIDLVGLALLVFWIGSLQIMLDIGRTHDWFEDPLIVTLAIFAVVGFCAFLIWELTEEHPIVDIRVFRHRGFSFGVAALSLCFGAYFASIVLIPQWLQAWMGYPATEAGFITACTAIAALSTSQLAGKAVGRIDARLLVSGAVFWLGCMAVVRSHWTTGADFWTLAMPQLVQGFGMAFFMLPLTTISLGSVLPRETASAAGLQNFVRTISIGVATALGLTAMDDTEQAAHVELAAKLQPDDTMRTLAEAGFSHQGSIEYIASVVQREAVMIGVDHVFLITAVVFFASSAVIWLAPRPRKPEG